MTDLQSRDHFHRPYLVFSSNFHFHYLLILALQPSAPSSRKTWQSKPPHRNDFLHVMCRSIITALLTVFSFLTFAEHSKQPELQDTVLRCLRRLLSGRLLYGWALFFRVKCLQKRLITANGIKYWNTLNYKLSIQRTLLDGSFQGSDSGFFLWIF